MPQNSKLKIEGWHQLMEAFGFANNDNTYHKLITAYSGPHRAYHTLDHIEACFRHLEAVEDQAVYPHEIKLAIWFHDVIYKPFSKSNEEDSAELAKLFLSENAATSEVIERVYDLIYLTKDHSAPQSNDAKLLLDIDLSILGTENHIYDQFEKDVRREYKRVPSFIFKKKRREILKSFNERPKIYHTVYFFELLEVQARKNIKRAIEAL